MAGNPKKIAVIFGVLVLVLLSAGCTSRGSQTPSDNLTVSPTPSTSAPTTVPAVLTGTSQFTPTAAPTTVQTPRVITSDDIRTHFMDLAFGVDTLTINKNIPGVISTVTAGKGDKEQIENFILEFNDLSPSEKISENLKEGEMADLRIKFIPQDGMKDISSYDKVFKSNDVMTSKIISDTLYINNNLKGDQRNHTILRSLYFIAGVRGDTLTYPDSLFYAVDNNNTRLAPIDEKALELFFGRGISNGMSVDDARQVIYIK